MLHRCPGPVPRGMSSRTFSWFIRLVVRCHFLFLWCLSYPYPPSAVPIIHVTRLIPLFLSKFSPATVWFPFLHLHPRVNFIHCPTSLGLVHRISPPVTRMPRFHLQPIFCLFQNIFHFFLSPQSFAILAKLHSVTCAIPSRQIPYRISWSLRFNWLSPLMLTVWPNHRRAPSRTSLFQINNPALISFASMLSRTSCATTPALLSQYVFLRSLLTKKITITITIKIKTTVIVIAAFSVRIKCQLQPLTSIYSTTSTTLHPPKTLNPETSTHVCTLYKSSPYLPLPLRRKSLHTLSSLLPMYSLWYHSAHHNEYESPLSQCYPN